MNLKITGRAAVLTSIDSSIIEKLAKFQPESLIMKDEKNDPIFKVSIDKIGSVGKFGIAFNDKTSDGKASLTIMLPTEVKTEDRQKFVEDNFSPVLWKLQAMEAHMITEFNALSSSFASVATSITCE